MTVARRIRRRGEHEISRKPLRAGMPGESGGPVVTTLVCLPYHLHARLRVYWAPGIPHALYSKERRNSFAKLGRIAPRDRGVINIPGCLTTECIVRTSEATSSKPVATAP